MSKWRRPKGIYHRGSADWFVDLRMAGGASVNGVAAQNSIVGLYNDATDGSILHVLAAQGFCPTGSDEVDFLIAKGMFGTVQASNATRIFPWLGALAGKITAETTAVYPTGTQIWNSGTINGELSWPYDYPMCYLAPGWSLLAIPDAVDLLCQANFHWLVMGKNEGYY
jgi:hypothetical protein